MDKESAYKKLSELIDRFEEHKESYKKSDYNETQTRRDFIDPFFKALGWDIDNEQGLAEAYREVIHEDKLKIDESTKAPDYCFTIYGQKKFYIEAKKPSVEIKDANAPAYQIRRYGWSAKLSISILTDFEEFAIYDCIKKPNPTDKPAVSRIKYLTYKEYLTEFDFLYDTFSKEKVLKGSFDKFVASSINKKGTSSVDIEFLKSMEEWRKSFALNIALRNDTLNEDEMNYTVQQTIDRLIFLRICEDRKIEPYGTLKSFIDADSIYETLFQYFQKADDKYNSGLFDFRKDKLSQKLIIDNKILKSIITEMYYPECPYEFSVIPVEILGNSYEQFLGSVIRLTSGHHAKVEIKPEVRKAGGVYYTPQYIVEYIVKNTVKKLIENKTSAEISKIKILDPACGSGSFLLGAYQSLLNYHLNYYLAKPAAGKRESKNSPLTPDGRLSTAEKKRILTNNIFGVDIDTQAVEVTKLSLLLKCLEGETEASVNEQLSLFHERVLPNLENNIKCGNSLIDFDFYEGKLDLEPAEDKKVKPFNWEKAFPEVFKQGGFDVVIGNPPYVRQEMLGEFKNYFQNKYQVYHGMADLYQYFIERGITLLNDAGLFGIIVANKWTRANYGEPLRKWLKTKGIVEIIDFGDLQVFESVTTYPCIMIAQNKIKKSSLRIVNVKTLSFDNLSDYVEKHFFTMSQETLEDSGWNFSTANEQKLLQKIKAAGIPLEEYVDDKIYRGVLTGLNEAFVIDEDTKKRLIKKDKKSAEIIKPFLAGRDIKRYQPLHSDKFIIFTRRGINIKEYPAILEYLTQYKENLMPKPSNWPTNKEWKGRKPGSYQWYEIQDSIDYFQEFEKVKIIYPNICKQPEFTYDQDGWYTNQKCFIISIDDKYLLSLLNSTVFKYLFSCILPKLRGGFFEPSYVFFKDFPIKKIDMNKSNEKFVYEEIVKSADSILAMNKQLQNSKLPQEQEQLKNRIEYTDEKINELVYKLYGLTEEEIKIVENV